MCRSGQNERKRPSKGGYAIYYLHRNEFTLDFLLFIFLFISNILKSKLIAEYINLPKETINWYFQHPNMRFKEGGNGQWFSYEETVDCGHNHLRKVYVNRELQISLFALCLKYKHEKL